MNKATASSVKTTSVKTKKVRQPTPVEATPAPVEATPAPVEATPATVPVEVSTVDEVNQIHDELYRYHMEQATQHKLAAQKVKRAQRVHNAMLKEASKKQKKRKAPRDYSKPKRPTGFAEPVVVSDELYTFLTKNKATMKDPAFVPKSKEEDEAWPRISIKTGVPVARTDVTSFISRYIKENNLQNPEAKREIIPDATLKRIFANPNEPAPKTYSYLQLQRYLSHHFPKKVVATA
jgi:hypothetical protein